MNTFCSLFCAWIDKKEIPFSITRKDKMITKSKLNSVNQLERNNMENLKNVLIILVKNGQCCLLYTFFCLLESKEQTNSYIFIV